MCSCIGLSFLPYHELFGRSLLHFCSNTIEKHQHVSLRVGKGRKRDMNMAGQRKGVH